MKTNRGIALVQVLIISMVLSILAIFISQSIRGQVKLTLGIKESVKLELAIETTQAQIIHALLTQKRYPNINSDNPIVQNWNFYNQPFSTANNVEVKLQDLNGLLNLNALSKHVAADVLRQLNLSEHQVRTFIDSLKDWIDEDDFQYYNGAEASFYKKAGLSGPRNGYLQTLDEVLNIQMGNTLPLTTWQKYFTEHSGTGFNPLNAPSFILNALLNNSNLAQEVINARDNKMLNTLRFYQITGIEDDEYYNFATGTKIRVELLAKFEGQQMTKQFVIELKPADPSRAVIITNIKWNKE